jgi:hypothetical protein
MSRPRATSNRYVMSQPVRRKTDADATGTNQLDAIWIFCGKLLRCPVSVLARGHGSAKSAKIGGGPRHRQSSGAPGWLSCHRMAELRSPPAPVPQAVRPISPDGTARNVSQDERPVRGDNRTGQAIWALGVDGRSRRIQPRWGGITAPTDIGRGTVAARSNHRRFFWDFFGGRCVTARRAARLTAPPPRDR